MAEIDATKAMQDPAVESIQHEVEGIREGVEDMVAATSLDEKVEGLRQAIHDVNDELSSWRSFPQGVDVETFLGLKSQVEDVQSEWQTLAASLQTQRDRLDAVLQSFPGVAEISTIHSLTLRVSNLESLVEELLSYHRAQTVHKMARTQLWLSVAALAATILLWGGFVLSNALGS